LNATYHLFRVGCGGEGTVETIPIQGTAQMDCGPLVLLLTAADESTCHSPFRPGSTAYRPNPLHAPFEATTPTIDSPGLNSAAAAAAAAPLGPRRAQRIRMPAGRKRPAPFLAFSSFARTLIFSTRAAASSSGLSKPLRLPDDATTSAAGTSGQGTLLCSSPNP